MGKQANPIGFGEAVRGELETECEGKKKKKKPGGGEGMHTLPAHSLHKTDPRISYPPADPPSSNNIPGARQPLQPG